MKECLQRMQEDTDEKKSIIESLTKDKEEKANELDRSKKNSRNWKTL